MVAIPPRPEQQIINRVYAAIEAEKSSTDLYLGRLGSSFIGEECIRQVWLDWRGFAREGFEGRMLRLFETGHLQEERIVADLRRAGFAVWDKQEDGRQFEFIDETGHFISKVDGVIKNVPDSDTPHVLEVKTHNKNSFSGVAKKGIQESKPLHYAQVQISMALGGFTRALYVAVCKDDEQFYVERVKEDKETQQHLHVVSHSHNSLSFSRPYLNEFQTCDLYHKAFDCEESSRSFFDEVSTGNNIFADLLAISVYYFGTKYVSPNKEFAAELCTKHKAILEETFITCSKIISYARGLYFENIKNEPSTAAKWYKLAKQEGFESKYIILTDHLKNSTMIKTNLIVTDK